MCLHSGGQRAKETPNVSDDARPDYEFLFLIG